MQPLTITTIQTNLIWENKADNLKLLEEKINTIQEKTELIILPEMFTTGFSMKPEQLAETMDGETVNWMKKISKEKNAALTGSIIIKENEKYFNRLIWVLPNGQYGFYDKRHLFTYAEEDKFYTPGNKRLIASLKGWKINLQICYDLRFPIWARQQNLTNDIPEYDILIYVANWPQKRSHAWKILLCARAIENQCFVVGVNRIGTDGNNIHYDGNTLILSPLGEILYHMIDKEDIFTITLTKGQLDETRSKFPFWKDADGFMIRPLTSGH